MPSALQAQRVIFPAGTLGGYSFTGALDAYTASLAAALSVSRRLLASYTGALIRVRRSSDNTESDFSPVAATGLLDTSAVSSFIGGGSGYIVTVYDQSGAGRNVTQSTAANQPLYTLAANSKPCGRWTGSTAARLRSGAFTLNQPYSRLTTGILLSAAANVYYGDGNTDDAGIVNYTGTVSGSDVKAHVYAGAFLPAFNTGSVVDTVGRKTCVRAEFNGASSLIKIGSLSATGNAGAAAAGGVVIGNRSVNGSQSANRDWFEEVVWSNIDQTRNETLRQEAETFYA